VSSSPPTCADLCTEHGCFFEGCAPGETQTCECDGGGAGTRTCGGDNAWSGCEGCSAPLDCQTGERQACDCEAGGAGLQDCEGGAWGPCNGCATGCELGTERECPCDGGQVGTQPCVTGGTWGDCVFCHDPVACTEGQENICECDNGVDGVQRCDGGAWGPCGQCEVAMIHADVDYGTEGITVGGSWFDVFDSTDWGCPAMEPGDDSLIWRLFINGSAAPETIWFEFDLPETAGPVSVTYWDMSIEGPAGSSEIEVYVNGAWSPDGLVPHDGCVSSTSATYPDGVFLPGETNRIEVWSVDNGSGQNHGLQGVWVTYSW
jgi:hypothetical protein